MEWSDCFAKDFKDLAGFAFLLTLFGGIIVTRKALAGNARQLFMDITVTIGAAVGLLLLLVGIGPVLLNQPN